MRKLTSLFLVFLTSLGTLAVGEPAQLPKPAVEAIDGFVHKSMEARGTPGLTLAITTDQALLYVGTFGYSDRKAGTPVSEETLFQIGSITKSFTALGLLQLHDQGLLDFETPVKEYLPWFKVRSQYSPILVHHLLTHSAGIPANRDNLTHSPLMVAALRDQTTAWRPGERYHYSNIGYQTLHFLLERVADQSYSEFMQTQMLDRLGMDKSRPVITLESRVDQAVGYVPPYDDRPHHVSRSLAEAPHFEYRVGDGSIQSTATDMAAYIRMLLGGGRGTKGRLVSARAFALFSTAHLPVREGVGYGYGIRISTKRERSVLEHSGGMVGFAAYVQADRTNQLGAVVLANGPADTRKVAEYGLAVVRAALAEESLPGPPEIADPARIESAKEYASSFFGVSDQSIRLVARCSKLFLEQSGEQVMLESRGKDTFYTTHPDFDRYFLHFLRDDAGDVNRVTYGASVFWKGGCEPERFEDIPGEWKSFTGRYRSYSPWLSYFEVLEREGGLFVVTGEGGESSSGEIELAPIESGLFRLGVRASPETITFREVVDGKALEAVWSGHPFYRTP